VWNTSQTNVSRVEHERDIYLSTLRGYIEALGGHLELVAVFPDQELRLGPTSRSGPASGSPDADVDDTSLVAMTACGEEAKCRPPRCSFPYQSPLHGGVEVLAATCLDPRGR
jgi:hypothetical protein